ncbi:ABC transporter ATP-binding protein [Ferrimicrobium sp.]|uniref:ATP-binding cassette domain-containing protein n=1 Tax=Ferrimicrobium sp. TaxID=2926050 RepID=UPI002612FAC9|nr:ABC transporter ATP-binding protein [Ferrimicrobium sp.]
MPDSGLKVEQLCARISRRRVFAPFRGPHTAVSNVSFTAQPGHVVGLVGPIGAGKTTLLHCLAGLRRPFSGSVALDGRAVSQGEIAFVDQRASLPTRFTVGDLEALGAGYNDGFDAQLFVDTVGRFDLGRSVRLRQVSEGQRKVVAIAFCLARRSRIILLDEPLASLDPGTRRDMMGEVLAAAFNQKRIVIMASHLVTDIERDCDSLLVMDKGQLLVNEAVDSLVEHHVYLAGPPPGDAEVLIEGNGRSMVYLPDVGGGNYDHPSLEEIVIARQKHAQSGSAGPSLIDQISPLGEGSTR